jgi:GT2 family glycosyltransferase
MTAPEPAVRVAVVVLNWNGRALTEACVRSLLAQRTAAVVEIHVVDNGSANGEAEALVATFGPAIRMHALPVNRGFAGGCNHAIEVVLAEGRCAFVALLNNDAEAEPGWIAALLAAAADPAVGAVASRMRFHDDPDRLDGAGVWLLSNGDSAPRGRLAAARDWDVDDDVMSACGGAVLVRAAALREVGLFRDDFFANFEDMDLFLRLGMAGHRIRYAAGAEVRHHLNATIAKVRDVAFDVRSVRNATWAFLVNLPLGTVLLNLPGFVLSNLAIVVLMPLAGRPRVAWSFLRGRLRALSELRQILRERRRLKRLRRTGWLRVWWRQRSFVVEYARLSWLGFRHRRGTVMRRASVSAREHDVPAR